ncbi:MAG: hypothetical protein PHU54_05475 [Candidatus Omnitrophica bacterium]|nr:hypothetical protein [Candidatus Omnitrophota bacterium]
MSTIGHSATIPAPSSTTQVAPTVPAVYPYNIDEFDRHILATGAVPPGNDVNLPASGATYIGRPIRVSNYGGGGAVNVNPNGWDTINGAAAPFVLPAQYDVVDVEYVGGGDWLVVVVVP